MKWTSTRSNRLLLDVTGSRYFHDFVRDPTDTSTRSQVVDQGSGITFGGLATSAYTGQLVYTTRAALTYTTGTHNLKAGWDWAAQIKPDDYMTFSTAGYPRAMRYDGRVTQRLSGGGCQLPDHQRRAEPGHVLHHALARSAER